MTTADSILLGVTILVVGLVTGIGTFVACLVVERANRRRNRQRVGATTEHPGLVLSLRTRSRAFGTLNVAVALRGRSTGWGRGGRPRRTFIGHNRVNPGGGLHFAELVLWRGEPYDHEVWRWTIRKRRPAVTR